MKVLLVVLIITQMNTLTPEILIKEYIKGVQIKDPLEYENLKIFPIITQKILKTESYVTLDEAIERGWLIIRESGEGEVNFVEVKNDGNRKVFMMIGEIISGAKQDRMLKMDVLIPPKSGWMRVPVYCVERGRWYGVSKQFKSEKLLVPNAVRQKAKITEAQKEVWEEIEHSQLSLGITSPTYTVTANYENEEIKKEIAKYSRNFKKLPNLSKRIIGVVVTTGNRIICVDIFANNELLSKLWDKLLKSYVMDALCGEKSSVNKEEVKEFIATIVDSKIISTNGVGIGETVEIESNVGKGSALVYENAIVHMDFFPKNSEGSEKLEE